MRLLALLVSASALLAGDSAFAWELPFPTSRFDGAAGVAVFAGGDVVAVGEVHPTNAVSVSDIAITRYDAVTGAQVWRTLIDGPATNAEEAAENYPNDVGYESPSRARVTSSPTGRSRTMRSRRTTS